jgi:hypothetical protein
VVILLVRIHAMLKQEINESQSEHSKGFEVKDHQGENGAAISIPAEELSRPHL